jgi:hypothetical protein
MGAGAALFAAGAAKGSAADNVLAALGTCTGQMPSAACPALKSLRTDHDTLVNAGTGVLIGGGALAGAAIVYGLWATFAPPPEEPRRSISSRRSSVDVWASRAPRIVVAPMVAASGGGVGLVGAF